MGIEGPEQKPKWNDGTEDKEEELVPLDKEWEKLTPEERNRRLREIG